MTTTPEFVNLPSGKRAQMLVASTTNKQPLCIIPTPILEWLIQWAPKALMSDILESFSEKAVMVKDVKEWVELLQEELDFHASINMLTEYFATEAREEKHSPSEHAMQAMV